MTASRSCEAVQVECWQSPQPFPGTGAVGAGEDAAQELVEQVQCVVTGGGFQVPGRGDQGRGAALLAHPGDGLGFGGGGVAGERLEPAG